LSQFENFMLEFLSIVILVFLIVALQKIFEYFYKKRIDSEKLGD